MSTYADWTASHSGPSASSSSNNGPVKLLVDAVSGDILSTSDGMELDHSDETMASVIAEVRQQRSSGEYSRNSHNVDEHAINPPPNNWDRHKEIPPATILLVIDTNWLINHLPVFHSIEKLVPQTSNYAPVVFVLSTIVLRELDGLKNAARTGITSPHAPGTASLARQAAASMLTFLQTRPDLFRGQRADEGLFSSHYQHQNNDDRILDCCRFFQKKGYQVGLLSDDNILCALAQSNGVPHLRYEAKDRDPAYFLNKLHPDLVPYFTSLRSATPQATLSRPQQADSGSRDARTEILAKLLAAREVQSRLMPEYNARYPILPPDLLILICKITSSLLSAYIYSNLLSALANDNLEIYEYMLKRMPLFRNQSENDILRFENWTGETCVKLLDMNWACFSDKAGAPPNEGPESRNLAGATNPFSTSTGRSSTTIASCAQAGVSASRWASPSSTSSIRRSTSGPSISTTNTAPASFHPSKLPALASSLSNGTPPDSLPHDAAAARAQAVLKWSPARWSIFLEDLEALLCGTMILQEKEDRDRARTWLQLWKENVECWRR